MDWLDLDEWQTWLIVALLLAGAELATMDLILLMLAIGSAAGCLAALAGLNLVVQVLIAVIVSLAMLGLVRPSMVRRMHAAPTLKSGSEGLIGKTGLVLERVTAHTGRVKLSGEVWSARTTEEAMVIEPGSKIGVAEIDGATAVVYPVS